MFSPLLEVSALRALRKSGRMSTTLSRAWLLNTGPAGLSTWFFFLYLFLRRTPFMKRLRRYSLTGLVVLVLSCSLPFLVAAQDRAKILTGADLSRVVPPGFYFQGLTAPTQMRNSAAARFGTNRYVI